MFYINNIPKKYKVIYMSGIYVSSVIIGGVTMYEERKSSFFLQNLAMLAGMSFGAMFGIFSPITVPAYIGSLMYDKYLKMKYLKECKEIDSKKYLAKN